MKDSNKDTPVVITRIHLLIGIILLIAVIAISLILWQVNAHKTITDIATNYHASSSQEINTIKSAALELKGIIGQAPTPGAGTKNMASLLPGNRKIVQLLHIINQHATRIVTLQKRYKHPDFENLVGQLQLQLNPYINLISTEKKTSQSTLIDIGAILLTLDQLDRLHAITNRDMHDNESTQQRTRIMSILVILFFMLVAGGIITTRILGSIQAILKHQRNTEARLTREKELTHTTLLSIGDAVITTDSNGMVTTMNPVAEQLTGWTNTEAQGRPVKSVFPIIDVTTRQPLDNPIDKVLTTGETVRLSNHTTLIARDGTEYQISDSAAPIRNNESIFGMVLVFNDVTEQYHLRETVRQNQQRLQDLFNDMQVMVGILQTDGTLTFTNNTPLKVTGLKEEDILGSIFWDIPAFSYDQQVQSIVRESCLNAARGAISYDDIALKTPDGLFWIEFSTHPVLDNKGNIVQIVAEGHDINQRKQQEELLRRTEKMDVLGKLTGSVAHDFNNMLGIVLGYANLLQIKLKEQPQQLKYANQILHAAERGSQLTQKLLAFTRQQTTDATVVDINKLINDEQHILEKTLTPRIKLVFDLKDTLWPVRLDSNELADIVLNMAINAMHAIDGQGQLTIKTSNERISKSRDKDLVQIANGDYVLLSLTDTGCGMDEATQQKIFDPFFTTKGEIGTGLGLSQVYGFVERSGGTIQVHSAPGQGTRFDLYFPRYLADVMSDQDIVSGDGTTSSGNETILIVDDEPALLELTSEILSEHGYNIHCAANAKQALDILEHETIDLMVSDVIMPDMDGYQLVTRVQEKYPAVKIQLASGFSDNRNLQSLDESLHRNMLHKPYGSNQLLQKLRELLDA